MKLPTLVLLSSLLAAQARFGESPFSLTTEWGSVSPEAGAGFDIWSSEFTISAPLHTSQACIAAITTSYEHNRINGGALGFDSLDSGRIGVFSLSRPVTDWRLMAQTNLSYHIAEGARIDDALTVSGIYGTWFEGWDKLLLGGGFGFSTQISDSTSFFPILFLDWEFTDHWHLTTRPTPGTRFGPGLSVYSQLSDQWALYLGARYVSDQYLLESDSTYEYSATRLFATLEHRLNDNLSITATIGASLGGSLEINEIEQDLDNGAFGGIALSWSF